MVQQADATKEPPINICMLGQDGHGKSSLASAITCLLWLYTDTKARTYEEIDGYSHEIVRGLRIDIAPIEIETRQRRYTLIDGDRYIDNVKHLITGGLLLHAGLLVVSVIDGITAQTREQVRLAQAVGIPAFVVFLNKCDLSTDAELLDVVELEVRDLLSRHGYAAAPVISGSATAALNNLESDRFDLWNSKIQDLLDAIDATIPIPQRIKDLPFLMSIDDVFKITTKGTAVVGCVERGTCRINAPVEIVGLGPPYSTIALDLEQFHKKCDVIYSGGDAGIFLHYRYPSNIQRGQVMAAPGTIQAHSRFRAELYLLTLQEGGRSRPDLSGSTHPFFFRSVEINGAMKLEDRDGPLRGGDTIRITVELEKSVGMEPGLCFALRNNGSSIGVGVVTEIL